MTSEPIRLARLVSAETGLACGVQGGVDANGDQWHLIHPNGLSPDHAFAVRVTYHWRRQVIEFEPGKFAGELLTAMGNADSTGRSAFRTILGECSARGGRIDFRVNGNPCDHQNEETWPAHWDRLSLTLNCRIHFEVREGESGNGDEFQWSRLFFAAVAALLPVEPISDKEPLAVTGYAEGAARIQQSIRYERDRRNRAAAIAVWGSNCQACGLDFGSKYGGVASGFIEVHHTTPVSTLEPDTIIDPARDLVPLCPNCHSVAHRRDPPFSVGELRAMLGLRY